MREPGESKHAPGWMTPAAAVTSLSSPGDDLVLLEATDETGWSHLAIGGTLVHEVPRVEVDPSCAGRPAAMGWIGYDGSARFMLVERSISFDHARRRLVVHGDSEWRRRVSEAAEHRRALGGDLREQPRGGPRPTMEWRHDDRRYLELIAECVDAIRRGDAYQLCLTNTAIVRAGADPWTVHSRLRVSNPTHRAGFLRLGGRTLVSASPERFVSLGPTGSVSSSPIKGTRPRDTDPSRDAALAAELRGDEKERAENLMIVDLVRNDLSRIAVTGTVSVDSLFQVESYPTVHQLVSTVSAQLRPGCTAAEVVAALFPAGSMTGAPKKRAMEILADFEDGPRGLYAGAFGLIRDDGSAELAMTIRGAEFDSSGVARIGAGGGITALSKPFAELAEMKLKAAPVLAALGVR